MTTLYITAKRHKTSKGTKAMNQNHNINNKDSRNLPPLPEVSNTPSIHAVPMARGTSNNSIPAIKPQQTHPPISPANGTLPLGKFPAMPTLINPMSNGVGNSSKMKRAISHSITTSGLTNIRNANANGNGNENHINGRGISPRPSGPPSWNNMVSLLTCDSLKEIHGNYDLNNPRCISAYRLGVELKYPNSTQEHIYDTPLARLGINQSVARNEHDLDDLVWYVNRINW